MDPEDRLQRQEFLQHRNLSMRISHLQESQRQLVQDIQNRYNELGYAVGHLRTLFRADEDSVTGRNRPREWKKKQTQFDSSKLNKIYRPLSTNGAIQFLKNREYGLSARNTYSDSQGQFLSKELPDFMSQHVPPLLAEKELHLGTMNKVFASKWLDDSQVVFGTKCNKLVVMDVRSNHLIQIPSLKSSEESVPADCPCGIHAIAINPSKTLLATGAHNTNDLAIYELPTFDAVCVGELAHKDWIFDMDWVDDRHIVTGSRDSSVALWGVHNQQPRPIPDDSDELCSPQHSIMKPCVSKLCHDAMRVRALAISRNRRLMGVLSMNAKFHLWDIERFQQTNTIDLQWKRENVCISMSDELDVFAVGSQAYVTLIDHRKVGSKNSWVQIPSSRGERGIRSLSFNKHVINIGTGDGRLFFYDTRISKFLHDEEGCNCELRVGEGWLRKDPTYREHFSHSYYPNAIYTHCYDSMKSRMFVAGGPLPAGLYGNYAGLFY